MKGKGVAAFRYWTLTRIPLESERVTKQALIPKSN